MNDVSEVWAEFCDGFYEVSSTGNIRRAKPGIATFVGRPVSPVCGPTGYKVIAVGNGTGKQQRKYVHHVVAEAFIGPRPDGHVVNHIDGDKQNNCAANLEYVTRKGNAAHAIAVIPRKKGPTKPKAQPKGLARGADHWTAQKPHLIARGSRMPHSKVSAEDVQTIRNRVAAGDVQRAVAADMGISVSQVSRIINGTRWGYVK